MHVLCRKLSQTYPKLGGKQSIFTEIYTQFPLNIMMSWYANSYFEFQDHYDDIMMYLVAKWDMKSYLRLILYLNMKKIEGHGSFQRAIMDFV